METYFINTKNGHWQFKKQGAERATFTADTKAEILETARNFVQGKTGVSVRIQRKDGTFQDINNY